MGNNSILGLFGGSREAQRQRAITQGQVAALDKSMAVIHFDLEGNILKANRNFCDTVGYEPSEIIGQHHSIFVEPAEREKASYRDFWAKLARGEFDRATYKRVKKNGDPVWIEATYNPIFDEAGQPFMVVKYATDVTERMRVASDHEGQIAAIGKSQAVIQFELDGTIISANDNFLAATGYTQDEVIGKHHSMFVSPEDRASDAYRLFWKQLALGEFDKGTYKRVAKDGSEIWIEATYNPIFDAAGRPFKVVKYATDVTEARNRAAENAGQLAAIQKSQAVIEFDMDGNILSANSNFLETVGYTLDEIQGRHHSVFVDKDYAASYEYREFWAKLNRGEYDAGQYARIGKGGRRIWIEASYNPILDAEGRPMKVVKYATDITEKMQANLAMEQVAKQTMAITASEDLSQRIEVDAASGLVGELCTCINKMLDHIHRNAEREQVAAADNLRIRNALDNVTTNVMIADNDRRIIYMNEAVRKMLVTAEADIQNELPEFRVENLDGQSIDAFHKNPDHQRRMLERLETAFKTDIKLGGRTFGLIASPVISDDGERLGTVVEWQDRTQELALQAEIEAREAREREIADENLRIRNALDNVSANVMIADNDRRITYINRSLFNMFTVAEADLREDLPQFDVRKVMGTCIDDFHKNPAHQERMISQLRDTHRAQIKVGGRTLALTVNPIIDDKGERRGTVVEWQDRKAEVAVEQEIGEAIEAANNGDFAKRIQLDNKSGFFHRISAGINQLMGGFESGFESINRTLVAMADGDFTQRIDEDYRGSWAELSNSVNTTVDRLTDLLGQIRNSSVEINGASRDIASGADDLSARTEQTAASLEETASSMEELTSAVRQNSENAEQANQLAVGASETANRGGEVVKQVVVRMGEITNSSREISEIISVIEGIAFQTNILALNAAVEAARAGEQGRGFAVVAGEVRSLAQRSSAAAKEIKKLISSSVDNISKGSEMVDQAGETMAEIVSAVKRVTDIMGEITAASREQRSGIEQVNDAITHMDQGTQQNAALVEESAAAAKSLTQQADGLLTAIQRFRFDADEVSDQPLVRGPQAAMSRVSQPEKPAANHVRKQAPESVAVAPKTAPATAAGDEQWAEF